MPRGERKKEVKISPGLLPRKERSRGKRGNGSQIRSVGAMRREEEEEESEMQSQAELVSPLPVAAMFTQVWRLAEGTQIEMDGCMRNALHALLPRPLLFLLLQLFSNRL